MSRFKEIEGHKDYLIYDDGRVYSCKRKIFLSYRFNQNGYKYVNLCKNGKYKSKSIHRLVCESFIDNPNGYREVNHIDGDKSNNDYTNLEWCDRSMNMKHASKLGLLHINKGEASNLSKLTKDDIDEIRSMYNTGVYSMSHIGKKFKVSKGAILMIINKKTWRWYGDDINKNCSLA